MKALTGIYVHIPFCTQKCPYCDFYSLPPTEEVADRYVDTVCRSFARYPDVKADTLYFGGGTPTLLAPEKLGKIVEKAKRQFALEGEITVEANPNTCTLSKLRELHNTGINRISFGVQSADPVELAALGRRHTVEQAEQAVHWAAMAGFTGISVDFMLGIPRQTTASLKQALDRFAKAPVTHLSCYMLKIEPNTPFGQRADTLFLPSEDAVCDSYLWLCERLETLGYAQYEISNFALPGCESRHNLKYWKRQPYLGFGPAAHSYFEGQRFFYPPSLADYLEAGGNNLQPDPTPMDPLEEYVMLALRLREGVSRKVLAQEFGVDAKQVDEWAKRYRRAGLLHPDGGAHLSLTPQGMLVSNSLITELVDFLRGES